MVQLQWLSVSESYFMYSKALKQMQNWKRMYNANNRIWQRWKCA